MSIFAATLQTTVKQMKQRIQWMLTAILLFCGLMNAHAQIPAEVREMFKACAAKMNAPEGTEMDMNIKFSMLVIKTNMAITVSTKGAKSLTKGTMKIMGRELVIEDGFDGKQSWKYKHLKLKEGDLEKGKEHKDSLIITKTNKKASSHSDIDFGIADDYQKAEIKKKDGRYEVIVFSKPKDKDAPKKVTVKIDKEKSLLREISSKQSGIKMTMTITRVKHGVNDNVFVLDTSKYPGAVIVRK